MVGRNPASNFKESMKINPCIPTNEVIYEEEVRLCNPAVHLSLGASLL